MLRKCGFVLGAVLFFILCSKVVSGQTIIDASKPRTDLNPPDPDWWKSAVFYQIYPRSFQDSNGDGIGDLPGITSRLPHLHDTGITGVWISQILKSPEKEHSQEISNFFEVDPEYGTMLQFDEMIKEAKSLGIKVILDFVLNHSNKTHHWFVKSEGREKEYEDFYVWRNKTPQIANPTPPTNWLSVYGDSAWEWSDKREQFYLHQFGIDQPDLNYNNPEVVKEVMKALKFWLDKGIDGFRLDSVSYLFEGKFEDEPKSNDPTAEPYQHKSLRHDYTMDQDATYQFIYELRNFIDQYNENHTLQTPKILMSEAYTSIKNTMKYYGDNERKGIHIPFNLQLVTLNSSSDVTPIVNSINDWLTNMVEGQTANWAIGNHDNHRAATRFGSKLTDNMNILIASLPGVMVTYNGEEIGQENGVVTFIQCKDPIGCNAGAEGFSKVSRDFERTPYHWDNTKYAGFMKPTDKGIPWLPVSSLYKSNNLKEQMDRDYSHYNIYKRFLNLRQEEVFKNGTVKVESLSQTIIKVTRSNNAFDEYGNYVVLINIANSSDTVKASNEKGQLYEVVYSTDKSIEKNTKIWAREVTIGAYSTIVFKVISKKANFDWWKHAVIYQVYPRSFQDSNNDGDGDLIGILNKLPYLKQLGVDVVWLSPIYQSPQIDQGYDISNFMEIDEIYGTMKDFDKLMLLAELLEIKIVMDFVPNHTSDKHEWFVEANKETAEFRDFYVWQEGKNGGPPNNWLSKFKNSAWTKGATGNEYYLHHFDKSQPDLNYRNEKVKQKMEEILTFWLNKGVAGFRMDAVPYLVEDNRFLDEPRSNNFEAKKNEWNYLKHIYTSDVKETFDVIYEWREFMNKYTAANGGDERIMMTEAYTDIFTTMYYYGNGDQLGAHFTFNFQLIEGVNQNSDAIDFTTMIKQWVDLIPKEATSNWVLGNHDKHRLATRFGPENLDGLNMLGAILPGVMVTYNGEEIGQENGEVTWAQGRDPSACNGPVEDFEKVSRDFERTPFHWDNSTNAGFNTGKEPWLPVSGKYKTTNLQSQVNQSNSHYELYKRLIQLRKQPAFVDGTFKVKSVTDYVLASFRGHPQNGSYFHLFNLGNIAETFSLKTIYNDTTPFLEVIETNDKKRLPIRTLLDTTKMTLEAHQSVIAIPTEKKAPSSTTHHAMSIFVILLGLLIHLIYLN